MKRFASCAIGGALVLVVSSLLSHPARLLGEERQLEELASRPSIAQSGLRTSIQSVTLKQFGPYASHSPTYQITFSDDDRYVYNGFRDVAAIGIRRGSFHFSELAAWLQTQPVHRSGRVDLSVALHGPVFEVVIERTDGTTVLTGGYPIDRSDVWGVVNAVQGAMFGVLASRGPA